MYNFSLVVECNYGPLISPLINSVPFDTEIMARTIFLERARIATDLIINHRVECILTLYKRDEIIQRLNISSL